MDAMGDDLAKVGKKPQESETLVVTMGESKLSLDKLRR
jgi:hypothetical protein